jgi:hypothetical protein
VTPTPADWLMFAIVAGVGIPAAFRSPVALVLVIWWLAGNALYYALGGLPLWASILIDGLAFVAVAWLVSTSCDLMILVLFFPTLAAHSLLDGYNHWLMTWLIGMTQLLLAGGSALLVKSWEEAQDHNKKIHEDIDRLFVALRARLTVVFSRA